MAFKLVTKADPKRVYAGPDKGWLDAVPAEQKTADDEAQTFETQEEAAAFANKHGMAVDIVALAKKKKRQEADE
jgi:hypothetical protein